MWCIWFLIVKIQTKKKMVSKWNDSNYLSSQWWSIYVLWCVWVMNLLVNESNIKKGTIMKHPEWKGRPMNKNIIRRANKCEDMYACHALSTYARKAEAFNSMIPRNRKLNLMLHPIPHLRHSRDLQQKSASGFEASHAPRFLADTCIL